MCAGSSPRAWGIRLICAKSVFFSRFIPTCVGNTVAGGRTLSCISVHPHVRGEYMMRLHSMHRWAGSSPRAWGILVVKGSHSSGPRFIPTCVGNTASGCGTGPKPAVHPHVRGEYTQICAILRFTAGSSPRAWGIPIAFKRVINVRRFIPTCVGNTMVSSSSMVRCPVHPHVRGEYERHMLMIFRQSGSSPRAWGIRARCRGRWGPDRFIPTCVGNTCPDSFHSSLPPVHPHVRGEYATIHRLTDGHGGSSPRAWGILANQKPSLACFRFIPTCVGNTQGMTVPQWLFPVHPHVRGEYDDGPSVKVNDDGSSPRAWGIRFDQIERNQCQRFIPTCVGNT